MSTNDLYPRFSDVEFSRRYALVRAAMQEADLSALVLYGTAGSYNEVQYLSNFLVTRQATLVFPIDGEPTLFVQYFNHVPNARRVAPIPDVRWGGLDITTTTAGNLQERGLAQCRIGIVGTLSFKHYESIKQALPHATILDFTPRLLQLRLIKSDEEIAFLRKGAEFSDRAIAALEREARPGITEHIHTAGFTICDDLLHAFGGGYLPPILRARHTSARPAQPFTFQENMTVVIQPNVITEDERMGVQVGELVRVTRSGVESLHQYPLRFIQCG